ncbi:argininosuccinate lyase [Fulvivirga sediminis]|uniref:Argininosuccinate lyase n=1 Tax=Fulvivirga sediminis TaxID=2803949 RepID=A0A937FEV5_9BACT|nr:argininosuccinate lyase [Fulvivirga sediminis]MBL3659088.1 argininosuccinate lyase [Fulvivirga sediminis]
MKLWDKGYQIEKAVEEFTVGNDRELDLHLAKYDVQGSLAHAQILHEIGILTDNDIQGIEREIKEILVSIEQGTFTIEENFEDVHSKVEHLLTEKLGDAGKKIHTARSRNDQVLMDMHLFCKEEIKTIRALIKQLFDRLITLSETHKEVLIPGYTHLQIAMPSSFGLWFGAYAEALIDDIYFLNAALKIADQNPLGSAAGYGSSFPINRTSTTHKMGFATLKYNSVAAQMSRGKMEKSISFALASTSGTLAKFAMDVCLYMSQNFGFLTFPAHLTTGSSIMPHKKNPDVFELIRGKCNKIQALPTELTLLINNLPSGYHRDFQLLKESLFSGLFNVKSCLQISEFMLQHIIINKEAINDKKYDYLYSVEVVNREVQNGLSFREAYQKVGQLIEAGQYSPDKDVNHTHEGSIGNLCNKEIEAKMDTALAG